MQKKFLTTQNHLFDEAENYPTEGKKIFIETFLKVFFLFCSSADLNYLPVMDKNQSRKFWRDLEYLLLT